MMTMQENLDSFRKKIIENYQTRRNLENNLKFELQGRKITIRDKHFNGQPYGRSRRSMYGRSWTFERNDWVCCDAGTVFIQPPFANTSIELWKCDVE